MKFLFLWLKIVTLVAKITNRVICKFEQVLFHLLDESVSIHLPGKERYRFILCAKT